MLLHKKSVESDDDEYVEYYEGDDEDDDVLFDIDDFDIDDEGNKEKTTKPVKRPTSEDVEDVKGQVEDIDDDYDEDEEIIVDVTGIKQCPLYCTCEPNMRAYIVASCNRLDLAAQSFNHLPITDLQVMDVDTQNKNSLSPAFFKNIGLTNVTSIKITNSSIEYISPNAFESLNELRTVNLTNIGIRLIHPDTFYSNLKLKILTLSGNNLNVMQSLSSPYTDYLLNSNSIEEFDISNCNMQEFLTSAFRRMKNVVYINMARNKLTNLPQGLFDETDALEELDLSHNKITALPEQIFWKTSLKILRVKHNELASNFAFVPKSMQKLDASYNKISSVSNEMFQGMDNLNNLILKGNTITRIQPAAFQSLPHLHYIDLSFNDLDHMDRLTFLKNSGLEVIRINDNIRLKTLPGEGFEIAQKPFRVFFFDASNCGLTALGKNTFKFMPFISRLYLADNKIAEIPKKLFRWEFLIGKHINIIERFHFDFSPILQLMELDLGNNSIGSLDPQTFRTNQDLSKASEHENQSS